MEFKADDKGVMSSTPCSGIKGMSYYTWLLFYFSKKQLNYKILQSFSNLILPLNLCTLAYKEKHRYVLISGNRSQTVGFPERHCGSTLLFHLQSAFKYIYICAKKHYHIQEVRALKKYEHICSQCPETAPIMFIAHI